ncbi:MAG: transcription antitermination factor NusB [Planctomycetota bacterium]
MRRRTKARQLALEVLYQADIRREDAREVGREYLRERTRDAELLAFAHTLIDGTCEHLAEIDEQIRAAAQNWEIGRMAVVDRNILRLAVFELAHVDDIPVKVSINEAIELAKKFGSEESGQFVNGILDKVKETLEARGGGNHHGDTEDTEKTNGCRGTEEGIAEKRRKRRGEDPSAENALRLGSG